MKGAFFQQPFELRLEVSGDDFFQGAPLVCTLSVKNQSASAQSTAGLRLELALGDTKKVKAKASDAFAPLSSAVLEPAGEIAPQQQVSFSWTFPLDLNAPIADKGQSPYLLYGGIGAAPVMGQLPVSVKPHPHIQAVLEILESAFQFVPKAMKWSKGKVQIKIAPSSAPRFTLVEELQLGASFEGDVLLLDYSFKVKRFAATESSLGVTKNKVETTQRLEPGRYLLPGGFINHQGLEAALEESLSKVASGL